MFFVLQFHGKTALGEGTVWYVFRTHRLIGPEGAQGSPQTIINQSYHPLLYGIDLPLEARYALSHLIWCHFTITLIAPFPPFEGEIQTSEMNAVSLEGESSISTGIFRVNFMNFPIEKMEGQHIDFRFRL